MTAPTLRKQLKGDPIFRAWMLRTPRRDTNGIYKNWRVFVQRKKRGLWARVDFYTYQEALDYLLPKIEDKTFYDGAISSKLWTFRPPIVRDKLTQKKRFHFPLGLNEPKVWWCPFCRRMTEFKYYSKHHNYPGKDYYCGRDRQCHVCGAGIKFTNPKEQRW